MRPRWYPAGQIGVIRRIRIVLVMSGAGVAMSACSVQLSAFSTNESVPELTYSRNLRSGMVQINEAADGLHPVCDRGGQLRGCYNAGERIISTIAAVQRSLSAQTVPSRYEAAHTDLLRALATDSKGFRLRGHAVATGNNVEWVKANRLIDDGVRQMKAALSKYPIEAGVKPLPASTLDANQAR